MKFVVYGPQRRLGVIDGAAVIDVANSHREFMGKGAKGNGVSRLPSNLLAFIRGGDAYLDALELTLGHFESAIGGAEQHADQRISRPLAKTPLRPPFPGGRIACAGSNYAQHSAGMARARGADLGPSPAEAVRERGIWGFWKVLPMPVGPAGVVRYPEITQKLDYEGEAAIVLGREGRRVSPEESSKLVWGVTLLIDWSIRDLRELPNSSFALPKNFDDSISLGPCIAVREAAPDSIAVKTRVNGELRQDFSTSMMVFSFGEYLEYLSRAMTLVPGDIISGGTGAGTAMDSARGAGEGSGSTDWFLRIGDHVEVESPEVGQLSATIVNSE